jgi:hypothetical protein
MRLFLRSSTALWRRVFQKELLLRYSDFLREGNFPESKLSGVCSNGTYSKYAGAPQETVFLLRQYSLHAEHHGGVTALREILLLEKIQG